MDIEEQELRFAATLEALEQEHERVRKLGETLKTMPEQLRQGIETVTREAAHGALRAVHGDIERARDVVVDIQRLSLWRAAWQHAMVALVTMLITLLGVWWYVPSLPEIEARRAEQVSLTASLADLDQRGARMQRATCGPQKRLCVLVNTSAGKFGEGKKGEIYMIAKGY